MPTDFERVEPSFGEGPIQPPSSGDVHAPSDTGAQGSRATRSRKVPLSRAPGKKKLLVGIPMTIISGAAYMIGLGPLAQMFFIGFLAYVLVGLVEVILGSSLVRAGEAWTRLAWWQRGLASFVVVVGAMALVVTVIPMVFR